MRNKTQIRTLGKERIIILFNEAAAAFSKNPIRSKRYVTLATRVAAKARISIPRELRRRYCRHCHNYLVSGVTARVRTNNGKLIVYCKTCKNYKRLQLHTKKTK